jgi:hypothetical protein
MEVYLGNVTIDNQNYNTLGVEYYFKHEKIAYADAS